MRMTRTRKALFSLGAGGALLGGAVITFQPLLRGDGVEAPGVTSIEAAREFQDGALLEKAWALPVARLYHRQIDYQRNRSFCGPASVVNVMRSLGLDGDQRTALAGTGVSTIFGFLPRGLTLDELGDIARERLGPRVAVLRDLDREEFRVHLRRANDPSVRYVINFSRGPLFGRGGGHHSPIAGYLADEDLVLVLDVNGRYRPWLVPSDRLYDAMDTVDRTSGKKRGVLVIDASAGASAASAHHDG
jgi:hypothetical protein